MTIKTILGNDAIALALVEQGCRVVTAYPGTPSSEILAGVVKYKKLLSRQVYTEWSTNEKVAFEVALGASWVGLRSAVAMKQVGLNVAADPLFSAAYTGVKGGFIIISADDPGPHSSQTEQDSRLLALSAKVPVFDPSSPEEAREMVGLAIELSERHRIPVLLRPTTRLCHAVQSMVLDENITEGNDFPSVKFRKDPKHWTAPPKIRHLLHIELNNKLRVIEEEFETSRLNYVVPNELKDKEASSKNVETSPELGIITSGVAFHTVQQALVEMGVKVPILKIGTPFPLPRKRINQYISNFETIIVLEEPDACIELQIQDRNKISGKLNGSVPAAGELTPEVVFDVLYEILSDAGFQVAPSKEDVEFGNLIKELPLPVRRPRLCPGCSHRSAFFAMKRTFGSQAIYPGDIGCYTLGVNLRAVDTLVDMGSSITMASGFFQANQLTGDKRPIIATIGDSTFIHSGVSSLINAVHTGARFVLLILDNHTTAMTGFQPTAESEYLADGRKTERKISIIDLVRGCGVKYIKVTDPYDQETFNPILKEAYQHTKYPDGGVAVVIANRPCILFNREPLLENPFPVLITEECDGCRYCVEAFECPALVLRPDSSRVDIDYKICVDCGQCIDACYKGFIVPDFSNQ